MELLQTLAMSQIEESRPATIPIDQAKEVPSIRDTGQLRPQTQNQDLWATSLQENIPEQPPKAVGLQADPSHENRFPATLRDESKELSEFEPKWTQLRLESDASGEPNISDQFALFLLSREDLGAVFQKDRRSLPGFLAFKEILEHQLKTLANTLLLEAGGFSHWFKWGDSTDLFLHCSCNPRRI